MNQTVSMRDLLVAMAERNASDLHITAGAAPTLRVHGHLVALDYPPLDGDQTKALAYSLINAEQRERFESNHELDFSYGVIGLSRYRVNVYRQRGAVGVALRSIPHQPKSFQELGLPARDLHPADPAAQGADPDDRADRPREDDLDGRHARPDQPGAGRPHRHRRGPAGVPVPAPEGAGEPAGGREDTHSFPAALKYVLRQDPDVVLIGEMRDLETIQAALTIAETGHLTFATLHTNSCAQSIDRIIDVFPPHQQSQVRAQLALVLEAVFNQLLIPRRDGRGRSLAMEILIATPAIRNMIREEKVHQIYSAMQAGQKFGMQTMNQSLANLYLRGLISGRRRCPAAAYPEELLRLIDQPVAAGPAKDDTGGAMPTFTYRGVTAGGGQVRAEITAADERAAARQLRSQGIIVQSIAVKGGAGAKFDLGDLPGLSTLLGGVRGKDISVFTRQFATMISGGPAARAVPADAGPADGAEALPGHHRQGGLRRRVRLHALRGARALHPGSSTSST